MTKLKKKAVATPDMVEKAIKGTINQTFSKSQIVKSRRYVARRDALNAILKDEKKYSLSEVEELLRKFEKGGKK